MVLYDARLMHAVVVECEGVEISVFFCGIESEGMVGWVGERSERLWFGIAISLNCVRIYYYML